MDKTKSLRHASIGYMRALVMLSAVLLVTQVSAQPFPSSSKFKVGMNAGVNGGLLIGDELENETLFPSMVLGVYYRQKMGDNLNFSSELNAAYKGSNFNNGITDAYSGVRLIYLDLPINLMFNTSGKDENQWICAGLEPSYLLTSEIYIKPNDQKATYKDTMFNRPDLALVLGYHFDFYYFGLRPSVRWGLTNINSNFFLPNTNPPTGRGGTISNLVFDLKFYF